MAPIPYRFLVPLIASRFALAISWTVIHPYVSDQISSFGVENASLGFWVGIIESCLQLAEIAAPILCYVSDYTGRKPIFVFSMLAYGWVLIPNGFSTTLGGVFFWRTIQGFCSAYAAMTKGIMAEICDHSNRGKAFGIMFFAFAVGVVVGPWIGGHMLKLNRFEALSEIEWLNRYPYSPPSLIVGVCILCTAIIVSIYLPETLPKEKRKKWGHSDSSSGPKQASMFGESRDLWNYLPCRNMLILEFLTCACSFSADVVFLVVCASPPPIGPGMTPPELGNVLLGGAIVSGLSAITVFPIMERSWTRKMVLGTTCVSWVLTFGTLKIISWISVIDIEKGEDLNWMAIYFWLVLSTLFKRYADLGVTFIEASVPDTVERPSQVSCAHSMMFSIAGCGRGLPPILIGALFSFSASGGSLRRSVVWMAEVGLAMFTVWFALSHSGISAEVKSAEDYELLEGRESLDGQPIETSLSGDVKREAR